MFSIYLGSVFTPGRMGECFVSRCLLFFHVLTPIAIKNGVYLSTCENVSFVCFSRDWCVFFSVRAAWVIASVKSTCLCSSDDGAACTVLLCWIRNWNRVDDATLINEITNRTISIFDA